jgi:biopolymer transport protein ExbD
MAVSDSAARGDRSIAQINITPLVDVLLVLLVIFMVTAPTLTQTLDMRLPRSTGTDAPPARLTLRVHSSGEFELGGRRLTAGQLDGALLAVAQQSPATLLELDTGAEAEYQGFARALGAARASGLENITVPR